MIRIVTTKDEMIDSYLIRNNVFLIEQQINPSLEFEEDDKLATHFVKYVDNTAVSTARILVNDKVVKIGRVATLKEHRKKGYSSEILKCIEDYSISKKYKVIRLGAQVYVKDFYLKLGYEAYGEVFLDAGIKHIMMEKKI